MASQDKAAKEAQNAPQPGSPQAQAAVMAPPQPERRLDEVAWEGGGGRFVVNGRLVNHDGEPINEDGSLKREEA